MAANDGTIASRLQLDGEKEYKQALNDAYRSLRVLRSELKAETAELGRNASEQDKARTKIASLQKQIAEQQKVVKTLEKALADSKREYADNQEVQDKWAEKLNKARAALAEMENAMGAAEDSLRQFGDGMKDVGNSSGEAMQTVVSFNDAVRSIGSIVSGIGSSLSGIFSNTVDTMQSMVDEMFSLMSQAWAAAGQWDQIQTIWGGDLASIERVYTAMALQGIDAGQVTSGIQKFITNVHNGNADTLAALEQLHMSEDQFSSHWDFFVAVMDRASQYKGQEGFNLMTALFGDKKGAGMTDMLKNWREAMNRYQQDIQETGLELSTPEIEELNKVAHKITEVQELWNSVKMNLGAKLSDVLNMDQLSDDALAILRDIGSLLSGEGDRKEVVLKLSSDIETLISDVSKSLGDLSGFLKELGGNLEKSDNPLVQFIGKLINSLSDVLDWLGAHGTEIISFLNQMLPLIATNKLSEMLTGKGIGDWVTDFVKLGVDFAVLGKLFGASAGAELGATASTFGAGIGAALLKAVPVLGFLATLLHVGPSSDDIGNNDLLDENGNLTKEAEYYGFSKDENGELVENPDAANGTIDLGFSQWKSSTPEEKEQAIQDWWDLERTAESEEEWAQAREAFDHMAEVLGDQFQPFWDKVSTLLDNQDITPIEDMPADWYSSVTGALKNLNQDNYKGASMEDLPGRIATAVSGAVKMTPININVSVDGESIYQRTNQTLGGLLGRTFG